MSQTKILCANCGVALRDEEIGSPEHDKSGQPICDECHMEYEFECCWCGEYDDDQIQHDMVVVALENEVRFLGGQYVEPGVYRVMDIPYWGTDYFSSWLYENAVEKIASLPEGINDEWPCGHLCSACQERIIGRDPE